MCAYHFTLRIIFDILQLVVHFFRRDPLTISSLLFICLAFNLSFQSGFAFLLMAFDLSMQSLSFSLLPLTLGI
jgi:hypothetical protein